jgi:fatty-acid peroxygenase
MPPIPRERLPDSTIPFALDPYRFISRRCTAHRSGIFETRILLQKTVCLSGGPAARFFYDESHVQRAGAAPGRLEKTLFGEGGVQGLDGEAHRRRKALFMSLMTPDAIGRLTSLFMERLDRRIVEWTRGDRIVLLDELHEMLTSAVCAWVGVPLDETEVPLRTRQLAALFEGAGDVGPEHWRSRRARTRAERWLSDMVERIRSDEMLTTPGTPLHAVAWYEEPPGHYLDARIAAVELLNLLRPTVAVARFITFGLHALHDHPDTREMLADADADSTEWFVQETRRFYPFFPATAARIREGVAWEGEPLPAGARALLDLYGTCRDPRLWDRPDEFLPDRFDGRSGSPYDLIPQGGGDPHVGHRCAGEWITIDLMKHALSRFANGVAYDVPEQDLEIRMSRVPATPRSGLVISNVRATTAFA